MNGQEQPPQHSTITHARGRWLVVLLVVIGAAAGALAVSYWSEVGRFEQDEATQSPAADAGRVAWDPDAAIGELNVVQQGLNDAIADGQDITPAIAEAWRLVERYPAYASARTLLAQALMYDGQKSKAYDQLVRSLGLDGQQPQIQILAGTLALQDDRLDLAEHHYSMAVSLDRSNPKGFLHLAQVYIRNKDYDRARRTLLEALQADSSAHQAYASLADVYTQQNKLSLALGQIASAVKHAPAYDGSARRAYVRRWAQLLRRDNQPEQALQLLTSEARWGTDPGLLTEVALCWAMLDRPEEAAKVYEAALDAKPLEWRFAVEAARWRIKAGDTAIASRHVSLVRRVNPQAPSLADLESLLRAD